MKKVLPWIIVLLVVAMLVIFKPHGTDSSSGQKQNQNSKQAVLIDARIVIPQPIVNNISVSGTLLSNEEVILQSQTAGIISHIYFSEGSKVRKGDLLVKIDDSQLQAQ